MYKKKTSHYIINKCEQIHRVNKRNSNPPHTPEKQKQKKAYWKSTGLLEKYWLIQRYLNPPEMLSAIK